MDESVTQRVMKGGSARGVTLPKGENGRNLCRWCNLEVPKGRQTFCSEWCVEQWRLRTDMSYLRERTFERDRGVCSQCGVDTMSEWHHLKRQRGTGRSRALAKWGLRGMTRKSLWDADHIVPVVEGGGGCDLDNIRTLCLICHGKVTLQLRERLKTRAAPEE
jgi:5-methylcytosine-specific restriction endonuclease McrA